MTHRRTPRRPARLEPYQADQLVGDVDPAVRSEAAHATAAALVQRGRGRAGDDDVVSRLVTLVESEGLETVAALWAEAPADSLPGALWRLYALREWIRRDPSQAANRYRLGAQRAEVADAVAGVVSPPGPREVAELADAVLTGVFTSDLDVALDRAAAFYRVAAVGTALDADTEDVPHGSSAERLTRRADALARTADELAVAARRSRAGTLE
ncbi:conserved hypothetical protein [Beutenbergia cavernae DSM 12333]|uniref:Histone acetyltransferase n=1 Tax=Beutenbergia cavernae (strain ATCC BAA-8 / DSM 12333 / CCUG 43141 / JCM 11478 / NBRC 16432 / NCIMB 13614 / HKI 0122) TaxID=471853 RepID=C5C247_BEUC1|nr:hypothetical protein [Beutenbergia cavernae]ACQ81672.1 conserved hypothetical protein [Beutenbergia cavernae DSM 12333]